MENSSHRRLESLSRHLMLQHSDTHLLRPNNLYALQLEPFDSIPVVIGGMVLDIHAKTSLPVHPRTTTPGKIQFIRGGVARNIAECMSRLGCKPFLISVVGHDMAGDLLLSHWKSAGLPTEGIQRCQDVATPTVSNIYDINGELATAIASVEAVEKALGPDWIWQFRRNISSTPVLMVDANMHPHSLESACQIAAESGVQVWFEPVSVTKSKRVASVFQYVTCTFPNEDELISMANALSLDDKFHSIQRLDDNGNRQPIESIFQMLKPAIQVLLKKGIKIVIVTLGSDGILLCSREGPDFIREMVKSSKPSSCGRQLYELMSSRCPINQFVQAPKFKWSSSYPYVIHFPALPASVVSLTGAGDCLVGGTLASVCSGLDFMQSVAVGVATAKVAVESENNVPTEYCLTTVADDARRVFFTAKVLLNQ